jgi:hypothetical protein
MPAKRFLPAQHHGFGWVKMKQFRFFDFTPKSKSSNGEQTTTAVVIPVPKPKKRKRIRVRLLTGKLDDKWQDWAKGLGGKWRKTKKQPLFEEVK